MKPKIIIFTIIIFSYIPGLHSEVLGKLKISVIDSKGEPIQGVKITLVDTQAQSRAQQRGPASLPPYGSRRKKSTGEWQAIGPGTRQSGCSTTLDIL